MMMSLENVSGNMLCIIKSSLVNLNLMGDNGIIACCFVMDMSIKSLLGPPAKDRAYK